MSLGKLTWFRWSHACFKVSVQVSMATLRAMTTRQRHTDKSVDILTNSHPYSMCKGNTMKTRKGGQSGSQKALNYGKQDRQTGNKNIAGMQSKGPCSKACKCTPPPLPTWPPQTAAVSIGSSLTLPKLHSATLNITFLLKYILQEKHWVEREPPMYQ